MGGLYLLVVDFREAQMRYAEEERSGSTNESIIDFEKMMMMMKTTQKTWKSWKGKTPLRDKSSLRHLLDTIAAREEEKEEEKRRRKEIVLLCGGEGCKGVNILRAFQLFLGLSSRCLWTTRVTMRVELKTLIPVVKTNGNRQDWLRVRSSGDSFEWGCGIGAECAEGWRMELRRLAKTLAENTSGTTFREDENALTMSHSSFSSSSSSSSEREEESDEREEDARDYFPSVQLGVREQLLEVSNDISKLFRDNREKYRSDDGTFAVVASTRERYDEFKKWHYVESLPTLYGVYLEVTSHKHADGEDDDDDKNLIGYASFHTEQAPPQFENVVENLNASKVQRFCVVNRLVVNPKYRGKGVKELLLRAGCDSYHMKGIACRITTSAFTAKVSLDACKLLVFERFKSRKDTGKERSSGKRKIVVNVPSTQKSNVNDDDNDEKKEREVKKDVLRMLNALTPDSSAKLTPKLRETFDALSEDDKAYVSGYIISLARVAPQFRRLLADVVLCTRLEPIVRKDAKIEIEKLSTSSSSHLSGEEVSARLRFLNAFVSEMNSEQSASRYLGTKDSALAMSRQDVFTAAKRDMKALRIIEEDSNTVAEVKRGQRSGWSYIYIGTPVVRRFDGQKYIFDGETNRFQKVVT